MVNQRVNELLSGSCFTRGFLTISAWAMSMPMVLQEEGRKMTWWILTQDSPFKSFAKQSARFYALSLLYGSRFTHLRHQNLSSFPGTDVPNSSSCQALPSGLNSSPSSMTTATVTPVSQAAVKAAPVTPATHVTPETAAPVTPGQGVKRSRSNEKGAGKSGDNAATWTGRRERMTRESCLDARVVFW